MSSYVIVFTDPTNYTPVRYIYSNQFTSVEIAEDHLQLIKSRPWDYPVIKNPRVISTDNLPKDDIFREAWTDEYDTPTVDIDLNKAKEIHLNRVREIRNKELEKSDNDFIKALSKGEDTSSITSKKQELRDIPQLFEAEIAKCESAEDLKKCWPEGLELHPVYEANLDA